MANQNDTGVFQMANGCWRYCYKINIDGTLKENCRRTDDFGNPFKTKTSAIKARQPAVMNEKINAVAPTQIKIQRKTVKEVYNEYCEFGRSDKANLYSDAEINVESYSGAKERLLFTQILQKLKKFFLLLLVWLVIAIVLAYVFQYLVSGISTTDNTDTVGKMVDSIPPILSCLMMSVFTPFIEEITFRKSLIGWIDEKNKTGIIIMMIVSIILFKCIHLFRWQEFFYYLPLLIALTLFYVKHNRNIYSSIIMHAMMNLPGAILMIIGII